MARLIHINKMVIVALAILFAVPAWSATLMAEWTPQPTLSATIDGTRIYQDTSASGPVASVVGVSKNTVDFPAPEDGKCHNYWATNYQGAVESPKSAIVVWCPPATDPPPVVQPPVIMGGFKITTTVTPLE